MTEAPITIVATCHGIEVPASPLLRPVLVGAIRENRYEEPEIAAGLAAFAKGARILELGAGSGIVGAVLAKHCAPAAMLSIEANPDLLPHITRLYHHNGLQDVITLRHGVVFSAPDAPATVTFNIAGNFLGSSLFEREGKKLRPVGVPVLDYAALCRDFPHDAIMMDIEGGELDFLRHADLSAVKTLILEMHRNIYGKEGVREIRSKLEAAGMMLDQEKSSPRVDVWQRT